MLRFLAAHGFDPAPTQRPITAGALAGAVSAIPAGAVLVGFRTLQTVADDIFRLSRDLTAVIMLAGFVIAGALYGALLRRAASDRRGGWIFGTAFGFLLWILAPVVVLPLFGISAIAAGRAGVGFLIGFVGWGSMLGLIYPGAQKWLEAGLDGKVRHAIGTLGPEAAADRLLKRWRSNP